MNWYDGIKYEIPESMDSVKREIMSKAPLIAEKKKVNQRLINASRFFSNPGLSPEQTDEGIRLLLEILNQSISLDDEIMSKDINIIGVLEARITGFGLIAPVRHQVNDLEEPIDSAKVEFYHTEEGEGSVQIGPEDMWFFKTARRLFNIDVNNIELR